MFYLLEITKAVVAVLALVWTAGVLDHPIIALGLVIVAFLLLVRAVARMITKARASREPAGTP
jgi:hypothetical protein